MNTKLTEKRSLIRTLNRIAIGICIVIGFAASSDGTLAGDSSDQTPTPAQVISIPASRQADRVAVITVRGGIDAITAMSVRRRIEAAETAGMDAMVFEINSPGGELGAVLEISNMIKMSSISNTIAWVRPDAYSGGAIVALACNEIVTSSPASMGDAFIVTFGAQGLRGLSPDERTKLLPPLMADVTDSARRSGYDEYLVQAIVADGIELWLAQDIETGKLISINESEHRLLFDGEVVRGKPMLAEVTGGIQTYRTPEEDSSDETIAEEPSAEEPDNEEEDFEDETQNEDEAVAGGSEDRAGIPQGEEEDLNAYRPASETLRDVEREFSSSERMGELMLEYPSNRPVLNANDRGRYRLVGYITDGSAAIVMRDDQLEYLGFSSGVIQNDEDLLAFFGGEKIVRVNMSWSEKMVRFMVNPVVRGFLIVVLLVALFVEMIMAGTGIAGAIAMGALVLLLGPPAMVGLSGWWELIAIVAGVICLAIEAFVVPGFGVFGVIGFVALFGGLIGTFVNAGGSMSNPAMQRDLMTGAVTVLLAFVSAGILWWLIVRNTQNLPFFDKLILSGASGVGGMPQKSLLHAIVMDDGSVRVGSEGVSTTPLYPIGQADFDGVIVDVYSAFGTIERGVAVRVVSSTALRIEVEAVDQTVTVEAG